MANGGQYEKISSLYSGTFADSRKLRSRCICVSKNKQANTYVKVVPVSSISTSDYGSDMYMYGQVVNNQRQQISVTTSQKISEVLVKKRRQGKYW